MKKKALALAFGISAFVAASPALAQELGTKGDAIIGAERLFGIRGEHMNIDNPAPLEDSELNGTTISLSFAHQVVPYNMPRATFDYLVINKLSVGGTLAYSNYDADIDGPGAQASRTDFELGPRVGYVHMFGRVLGIWPRGGLVYHSTSLDDNYNAWTFGLNLECMFPIVIVPHFGVLVGFAFDQSLTGNLDPEDGPERDISMRSIALQAGLFGWL